MGQQHMVQQTSLKKWTLKEKINYIREVLTAKGFNVILKSSSLEWVSQTSAEAGNVQLRFLQELGELDFDTKISHYFSLITDKPGDKESATQRERRVRDDLGYYMKAAGTLKKPAKKAPAKKAKAKK